MELRDFYCYLTPKTGGQDRELKVKAINYGEAEGLISKFIEDGEFISRIEQELPHED